MTGAGVNRSQPLEFSDEELVREIRAGSTVAFAALMRRYERLVFTIAWSYVRQRESALDVSQDVFIRAYRKLHTLSGAGSFKAWLLRITHRECVNWLRRNSKYRNEEELTPDHHASGPPQQEAELLANERREQLLSELAELSPRQQLAVTLRYFESMSVGDIARVLETTEGTVKSILFRSLRKMRDRMTLRRREDHERLRTLSGDDCELSRG
jgi:RNA polymerase sigma-70 factor (ECF subfamily)